MMTLKKYIGGIMIAATLLIGASIPQKTEAFWGVGDIVYDPAGWFQALASATSEYGIWIKEIGLDGLTWMLINGVLETMIQDVTTWVNNGFEGSPAFLDDPEGFFLDVADIAAGKVLARFGDTDGDGEGPLCRPIEFQIRYTLHIYTYGAKDYERRFQCKLSDMVTNLERFYEGNIREGGILSLNVALRNNPYAQISDIGFEIKEEQRMLKERSEKDVASGNGFLSQKKCFKKGEKNGKGEDVSEDEKPPHCTGPTQTPGSVISETLSKSLNIGADRLTVADEIDELVGALLSQVVTQVVGGSGGLIGLSKSSGGGNPSFFDSAASNTTISSNQIRTIVTDVEKTVRDIKNYERVAKEIVTAASSTFNKANAALQACTTNQASADRATQIRTSAESLKDRMGAKVTKIPEFTQKLSAIRFRLEENGENYAAFKIILADLETLKRTYGTYNLADIVEESDDEIPRMRDLGKEADTLKLSCGG